MNKKELMKTVQYLLILMLMFGLGENSLYGQKMREGIIKMEVVDAKASQPEMQQMIGAMKGSTQEIHFNQEKQHIVMSMMGGLMTTNIYQEYSKKGMETYLDMMGQKIKMVLTPEQAEAQEQASEEILKTNPIQYDRNATKEILGYTCTKAKMNLESNGQKMQMVFWLTKEIDLPKAFVQNLNNIQFDGAPLAMEMNMGPMTLIYEAVEISKTLGPGFYKKPSGEYKEMSMEDLQKMGMGGQLGF